MSENGQGIRRNCRLYHENHRKLENVINGRMTNPKKNKIPNQKNHTHHHNFVLMLTIKRHGEHKKVDRKTSNGNKIQVNLVRQ